MAQGAHLSPFGNLGNEEDGVLYTEIVTEARKGRSNVTKGVGPSDPEEDPAESKVPEAAGTIQERTTSEGNLEFKRNSGSPSRSDTHSRPTKPSAGSDYSIDKSLMQKPAGTPGRGSSSPMSEARTSRDGIHSTPGRAHLTSSSRGDDHDKGVTVPKFGEWDDRNPTSGLGYTQVFNAVREERQGIVRSGTDPHVDSSHSSAARRANSSNSKGRRCGCCPWLGI